jgi:hypothetical protein
MKKGCLIALGIGVALVIVVLLVVFGVTRGVVKEGNNFLGLLGAGKIGEAYENASPTLKAQQTEAAFERGVKKLGLTDFASASWSSRELKNDRGHLEGSITTKSGGKIPLQVELIKESGKWKVYAVTAPQSGIAAEPGGKQMPSDDKLKEMARESLLAFNKAVHEKSFVNFHKQISTVWQQQITPEKFMESFQPFVDKGLDLSPIKKTDPIFDDPPAIDSQGILTVKGYFPTQPAKVFFRLRYVYEHPTWKLLGIRVNVE